MRIFRFVLFLVNLGFYIRFDSNINLYVAIFLAVIIILEELYDRAPKLSKEAKARIDKIMQEEHDRIMAERLKGTKNVKYFKGDRDE